MSKIVVPMNVSITEEYYDEFLTELESKGFIRVPLETSEGTLILEITKLEDTDLKRDLPELYREMRFNQ